MSTRRNVQRRIGRTHLTLCQSLPEKRPLSASFLKSKCYFLDRSILVSSYSSNVLDLNLGKDPPIDMVHSLRVQIVAVRYTKPMHHQDCRRHMEKDDLRVNSTPWSGSGSYGRGTRRILHTAEVTALSIFAKLAEGAFLF